MFHRLEPDLTKIRTDDKARQAVIVTLSNGVELVIVTASAGDRQTEKRLAQHVDLVVGAIAFILPNIDWRMYFFAEERPTGSQHRFVPAPLGMQPRRTQQVARKML